MNLWNTGYLAGALIAGMLIPIQTGYNTQLGRALNGPVYSTMAVFAAAIATTVIIALLMRTPLPAVADAARAPALSWVAGGALGAIYIVALTIVAPKLGAAATVALVVSGQMICSAIIDHFGLLGFPVHEVSALRMLGFVLMAGGVVLVRLF